MLFKLNLMKAAFCCLLLLPGLMVAGQFNGDGNDDENEAENPFGSGKTRTGGGGTGNPCNDNIYPTFSIELWNVFQLDGSTNHFPCLLHVGITGPDGETAFVMLDPANFEIVPEDVTLDQTGGDPKVRLYYDIFSSPIPIPLEYRNSTEDCRGEDVLIPYDLQLFCLDTDHDGDEDIFIPLQHCGPDSEWTTFFSNEIPAAENCDDEDAGIIRGTEMYRFCCHIEQQASHGGHGGPRPLVSGNGTDFNIISNYGYSTIIMSSKATSSSQVIVTDLAGRTLSQTASSSQTFNVDHTDLQSGLYFITVYTDGIAKTKKIFVQ